EIITVNGFYDDVKDLTRDERALIEKVKGENYRNTTGVQETVSEHGYNAKEHTMARPTFELNGMYGGYQGEGSKTSIPSIATAKITCRLVPDQDTKKIQQLLQNHIKKVTPTGVKVEVKLEKLSAKAYRIEPTNELIQKAANCYEKAFRIEPVFV